MLRMTFGHRNPGPLPTSPRWGYALPITRILHCPRAGAGRGSDDGRASQPGARSARLRRAWCWYHSLTRQPYMCSPFGVRQPCCRASRAHDPVRGIPFPILVTEKLDVFVSIIESVRHECDTCA